VTRIAAKVKQRFSQAADEQCRGIHEECVPLAIQFSSLSFTHHGEDDRSGLAILCKIAHYSKVSGDRAQVSGNSNVLPES
jgi:hypothetical protein